MLRQSVVIRREQRWTGVHSSDDRADSAVALGLRCRKKPGSMRKCKSPDVVLHFLLVPSHGSPVAAAAQSANTLIRKIHQDIIGKCLISRKINLLRALLSMHKYNYEVMIRSQFVTQL